MKEQHRYAIIVTTLVISISFMINNYYKSTTEENNNMKKVVANINNMDKATDEFITEVVSLGEFTASDSKLTIVESELDIKSNTVNYSITNANNYYSSNSNRENQMSRKDKLDDIVL